MPRRRRARAAPRGFGIAILCALATALLAGSGVGSSAWSAERKALVKGVGDRALAAAIERAIGDEPSPPANRLDARRRAVSAADSAEELLRSEGYYDAQIDPDVGEGEHPRPIVTIEVGPRTQITAMNIAWQGDPPPADVQAKALKAVATSKPIPAQAAEVLAAEGRAVAALQQAGYADAAAEPRDVVVDHADHTMSPTYKLKAGSLVRLGALTLPKRGRTRSNYLQTLVPWKPGEVYTPTKVAELERRLQETQAFDTVAVSLAPEAQTTAAGLRPVVVTLVDRAKRTLDFSAGYSTTEGADFDVRYSIFNTLRRADTITLEARLAEIDSRFGGELSLPNFSHPGRTLKNSAYLFRNVTDAYTETGVQLATDLTQRYGASSFVTVGGSITDSQLDDKELGKENVVFLRAVGAFLYDRSDNTLSPTRGFKLDARAVPTLAQGDADQVYLRLIGQASGYLPLTRSASTVIAARLRIGSIVGGSIPAVPSEDRFFAGGGGSVRGYEFQGVGPAYPDATPKGGLSLVEASVELRQRIRGPFGAVAFIDAGSVGSTPSPDFRRVSPAVGFGLRYDLGFAPVRVDIAVPLKSNIQTGGSSFQLYLSVGQAF